ncbi:MAG: hypothetical protein ACT4OO_03440 [Nitrospiraceae bacterium]
MSHVIRSDGRSALTICACGKLHFTYGPITLHFEPEEFVSFAGDIAHLLAQFRLVQDERRSVPTSTLNDIVCH